VASGEYAVINKNKVYMINGVILMYAKHTIRSSFSLNFLILGIVLFSGCSQASSPTQEMGEEKTSITMANTEVVSLIKETPLVTDVATDQPLGNTETPPPTSTPTPENWQDYPVIPDISPRAIEIYQRGIALGNDPHRFSKIGDCQSIPTYFLAPFEDAKLHSLGDDYAYLQVVIDWYFGSYSRMSLAVAGGLNVARVLSPFHADVDQCAPNEHSLACEVRIFNPSVAIVSLEENWSDRTAETYEEHLRTIIEYLIDAGILPILATKADNLEGDHSINKIVVRLAGEYEIPLWNFWRAVQPIPNHGLQKDGFHLTLAGPYLDDPWHMKAAWPWRNLTALQSLDAVLQSVNQP
jgi:hypothetical protein